MEKIEGPRVEVMIFRKKKDETWAVDSSSCSRSIDRKEPSGVNKRVNMPPSALSFFQRPDDQQQWVL